MMKKKKTKAKYFGPPHNSTALKYVSSLTTHMTTGTKYPIGSNALWEGYSIKRSISES